MSALDNPRLEALAQALADGLPIHEATRRAGFSRQSGMTRRRCARRDVRERIAEIRLERARTASDVRPVIEKMMALAEEAGKLKSGAGMTAAHKLLVEAARLKATHAPSRPRETWALPPQLSKEEWLDAFAPKTGTARADREGSR
ncbi:MAG: hypothetical protein ACRED9_06295 [Caulobacteraceae bacterium]